jgi:hypothetical protein
LFSSYAILVVLIIDISTNHLYIDDICSIFLTLQPSIHTLRNGVPRNVTTLILQAMDTIINYGIKGINKIRHLKKLYKKNQPLNVLYGCFAYKIAAYAIKKYLKY